jgi:hypothetical protein
MKKWTGSPGYRRPALFPKDICQPLSRCTKLGDLENMDRFVALIGRLSNRIALN